jgi:protein O-mannosyl-transferase
MEIPEEEFSLRRIFIPLTTLKSINWIIAIGLIVFFNMLFNGFVWDDFHAIINNPDVHSLNIPLLIGHNSINSGGFYRPLAVIFCAFFYKIFGEFAFFYHLTSLTIHLINVSLLFILFKHFFSKKLSLFLCIIFLIHPIQVETVSYISGSGDLLFFLFGMSALLFSLKDNLSWKKGGLISLLIFLSMMFKETGFLFLLAIISYKSIFKHKNIIPILVGGFASIALYLAIRFGVGNAETTHLAFAPIYILSFVERISNIPKIIYYYLITIIFPANLAIAQYWVLYKVSLSTFYFPLFIDLLFFIGIALTGLFAKINKKLFLTFIFFTLFFLMGLSLHLQIIPLDMTVSDRWFYFPFVGLLGIIGIACRLIKLRNKNIRIILYVIVFSIIAVLSIRTMVRNTNWVNNLTLYAHDVKVYDNYILETSLGYDYYLQGNDKEFLYHTNRSIKLLPNEMNISNLAFFYLNHRDVKKAQMYYEKALAYNVYPSEKHRDILSVIYRGMVWSYIYTRQFEQARTYAKTILPRYPLEGELWGCLAISEYELHNKEGALVAAEKAKILRQSNETNYIYNQILNNQPIELN